MQRNTLKRLLAASALAAALPVAASAQQLDAAIVPLTDWNSADLYSNGFSVQGMLGTNVNDPTGQTIGHVENVLFNADGTILSVIASIGGFLNIGDTHINIPWDLVSNSDWAAGIEIPFSQETLEDYSLFNDGNAQVEASEQIAEVGGDGLGQVETGPGVYRATDIIGDYARLRDGSVYINYGYVDDVVVQDGSIAAVLVTPDVRYGGGRYAYPYYGANDPQLDYTVLPYDRTETQVLQPFDVEALVVSPRN